MSDDLVRDKVRLYAADVTPAQLPSFSGVAVRRRRRRLRQTLAATSTVVVAVFVVVFAALASRTSASRTVTPSRDLESQLVGPTWTLSSITDNGVAWPVPAGRPWTLRLSPKTYSAHDGCNAISGPVSFGDGSLTFGPGAITDIGCPGADSQRLQQAFQSLESGPAQAAVASGTMTLTVGPTVLTLTPSGQVSATPSAADDAGRQLEALLTSHTWLLKSITSAGATWNDPGSSIEQQQAALVFGPHGYVINPDCNDHSGAVSYASGRLIMRAYMQTAAGCPEADVVQAKSARVADALFSGSIAYEHQGGSLVLANQQTSIAFTAGPKPKRQLGLDLPPAFASRASGLPGSSAPLSTAASLESELVGPVWSVRALSHEGVPLSNVPTRHGSVTFTAKGYTADDSCNQDLRGRLAYGAEGFTATGTSGATKACPPTQDWSQLIDRLLQGKTDAVLTADVLTLSAGGDVATLDSQPQPLPQQTTVSATELQSELVGPKWLLESWTKSGKTAQASAGSRGPFVQFSADGVLADDGCNGHSGRLTYQGSTIRALSGLGSTTALCAGDSLAIQGAYDSLFSHTVAVYVSDNRQRLALTGASGEQFFLHRDTGVQLSPVAVSLIGPTWKLQSVKAPGVDWHRIATSNATLVLTASAYQASDGCNSYGGDLAFEASGTTLTFGANSSSGECVYGLPGPPAGTFPPADYFNVFAGKAVVSLADKSMTITNGQTVLSFTR